MFRVISALVIDSDPLGRAMLKALFEGLGCRVVAVTSVPDAVAAATAGDFDLVCMDPDLCEPKLAAAIAPASYRVASSLEAEAPPPGFHAAVSWPIDRQAASALVDQAAIWRALRQVQRPTAGYALQLARDLQAVFAARPELLHLMRRVVDACDEADLAVARRRRHAA